MKKMQKLESKDIHFSEQTEKEKRRKGVEIAEELQSM